MAKKTAKLKPVTNEERADLWSKVDHEGFGYYMIQYGPDLDLLQRMGFDRKEVEQAIELFDNIRSEITKGEKYVYPDGEEE